MRIALAALCLALAACSGPERRIKNDKAFFETLPAADQEKIRKGHVEIGYTEPMVKIALGKPYRRYTRKTETETLLIWAYPRSRVGVGLGVGGMWGGGGSVYGSGVSIGSSPGTEEKTRVVFRDGKVVAVETADR